MMSATRRSVWPIAEPLSAMQTAHIHNEMTTAMLLTEHGIDR
jgi:hypothetical protein